MAKMFSKYVIEPKQIEELCAFLRKGSTSQGLGKRVRIVLLSADGKNTVEERRSDDEKSSSVDDRHAASRGVPLERALGGRTRGHQPVDGQKDLGKRGFETAPVEEV